MSYKKVSWETSWPFFVCLTTGTHNVAVGNNASAVTTGNHNVAVGYGTLGWHSQHFLLMMVCLRIKVFCVCDGGFPSPSSP